MGGDEETGAGTEAVRTLRTVLTWEKPESRWDEIAGILDAAEAAVEAGDADTLADIVGILGAEARERLIPIGGGTPQPPPPPVRERLDRIVHKLSGPSPGNAR